MIWEHFFIEGMNIATEFLLPSMIRSWDLEHHNINIETSPTARKIIQAWRY